MRAEEADLRAGEWQEPKKERPLDIARIGEWAAARREAGSDAPHSANSPAPDPQAGRRAQGRRNHIAGVMAEDCIERFYVARGGRILGRRVRSAFGEIDLIVLLDGILVFVEVKRRKRLHDCPVGERQWRRLEAAATHYMLSSAEMTGAIRGCRFDLAILGRSVVPEIIENARSFDEH